LAILLTKGGRVKSIVSFLVALLLIDAVVGGLVGCVIR
jgi:hypothetical protein